MDTLVYAARYIGVLLPYLDQIPEPNVCPSSVIEKLPLPQTPNLFSSSSPSSSSSTFSSSNVFFTLNEAAAIVANSTADSSSSSPKCSHPSSPPPPWQWTSQLPPSFRNIVGLDSEWKMVMYEDSSKFGSSILQISTIDHCFILDLKALSDQRKISASR